jgi:starvation-inducible outer membrane lipoprotein
VPFRDARSLRAYNVPMHHRTLILASLLACASVSAQNVPPPPLVQESQPLDPRKNQKVERIHHEDSGSVIDEVRYGGQTQSITVQPKADMPEYEFQPSDMARSRPGDHRDGIGEAKAQRVWNLFRF